MWEVVSLLGKLLGTVAALKVVLYLLRVCFAMAWKSGGASHSELIHNLRSKCHPRPARAMEQGRAWTLSPPTVRNVRSAPLRLLEGVAARLHRESGTPCVFCSLLSRDLSLSDVDGKRVEAKRELLRVGRGSCLLAGCGGRGAALVAGLLLESTVPPARGVTSGWGSAGLCFW